MPERGLVTATRYTADPPIILILKITAETLHQ